MNSDVLAVVFRPDGDEIAVSTLDAQITFWNTRSVVQTGSIEGRHDLGYSRKEIDKITAKKSSFGKAFNTICYSADGKCLLAAGRSKNVCIYSIQDQILMKKFEISANKSFDGMEEFLDKKKMTEWGNLSLVDQGEGDEDGKSLSLPGVKKGDMSSRHWKPEVRVSYIQFSPTGRAWAATTTEGMLVYSLDQNLVFDPYDLEIEITPVNIKKTLDNKEYSTALILSFRLNENKLIQEVLESIPYSDIDVICENLPDTYVDKLLNYLSGGIEFTAHVEFYVRWINKLLMCHGPKLKQRSQKIMTTLRTLQKNVARKYEDIGKLCDYNRYSMDYIIALSKCKRKHTDDADQDGESEASISDSENQDGNLQEVMDSSSDDENFMSNFMETE